MTTYASLRPFHWAPARAGPMQFLLHPHLWVQGWDFVLNIAGYFPLGFLGLLAFSPGRRRGAAAVTTLLACAAYSVTMETLQNFLPGRTPSAMDVITNVAGAALGTMGAVLADALLDGPVSMSALRERFFEPGLPGALGVVLLGAWLLGTLAPRALLYASGDLHLITGVPPGALPAAGPYPAGLEAVLAAANLAGIALLLRVITTTRGPLLPFLLGIVAASLIVHSMGFGMFWTAHAAFDWLTPGAKWGLAAGLALAVLALRAPRRWARPLAALVFTLAMVGVNVAPPNPRAWMAPLPGRAGQLRSISAVTALTVALWPVAAVVWVLWPRRRRGPPLRVPYFRHLR